VDEWELYDRKKDKLELNNVYDDPAYQEVVEELTVKLEALREKYKDSKELDQHFIDKYKQRGIIK
jgi:flagellar motility protein MotE (MotC chaperone)